MLTNPELDASADSTRLSYYLGSNQLYKVNNIQVEHDATGNLTRDSKNRVYEYDGFGRLAKITGNETEHRKLFLQCLESASEKGDFTGDHDLCL